MTQISISAPAPTISMCHGRTSLSVQPRASPSLSSETSGRKHGRGREQLRHFFFKCPNYLKYWNQSREIISSLSISAKERNAGSSQRLNSQAPSLGASPRDAAHHDTEQRSIPPRLRKNLQNHPRATEKATANGSLRAGSSEPRCGAPPAKPKNTGMAGGAAPRGCGSTRTPKPRPTRSAGERSARRLGLKFLLHLPAVDPTP